MAQVKTGVQQTIDEWLDYLTEAWQALPGVASEIDRWNLIDQIDYVEEWAPKEEVATQLRQLIALPEATEEQRRRYAQLDHLMRTNRPVLEQIRAD